MREIRIRFFVIHNINGLIAVECRFDIDKKSVLHICAVNFRIFYPCDAAISSVDGSFFPSEINRNAQINPDLMNRRSKIRKSEFRIGSGITYND